MRIFILFFLVLIFFSPGFSQEAKIQELREDIDSIINRIDANTSEEKKVHLILSIYGVASIDGYPVLIFELYQKLFKLSQQRKDVILESSAWSALGQAYRLSGDYVKALECHQKAVDLALQSGNTLLYQYSCNQFANIYKDRQENEKALKLYRIALGDNKNGKKMNWWAEMNMGAVFLNQGKLDSALYYSYKAIKDRTVDSSYVNIIYISSNLGSIYSLKHQQDSAMLFFNRALSLNKKLESPRFYNLIYTDMALHYNRLGKYDSAIYYSKRAVAVVQHTMLSNLALKPARLLTNLYERSHPDSALQYWKIYNTANDSLYNLRANQQMMMMSFEEEQRKKDIEAEKEKYRNKIQTTLILTGLGIALLIALILYRNNRQKRKANLVLEKTLSDLKSTQSQLIHAEKMASLGELTAGIAHEIQNPLNFVNNFSEVNKELISELVDEVDKGNTAEVKLIAEDIWGNSNKIHHHGKRADEIVKGMLQHSRTSSGKKEPTDMNALCDEYLRLAYHARRNDAIGQSLRAKDKSFDVAYETNFDNSIGSIKIVPQEIGRVLLNLINNAFYAVNEKKKTEDGGYHPLVRVTTKNLGDKIEITVKDNGSGIPTSIKEKIFQPFFTTKPAGQGTGLGLSLAYDIIKAHGGELRVDSKEGEFTLFTVSLPVNKT